MSYVNPQSDLGAVVTLMDGGDAGVARMQSAINRVIMNARNDMALNMFWRDTAKFADAPIPVNGQANERTMIAGKSAAIVAGISSVGGDNAQFTEKLEAFADSRGYPSGDTIATKVLGVSIPEIPALTKLGISPKTVAIGGAVILLAGFLFLRRRAS